MAVYLGQNNYGKSRVRLVKVTRDPSSRRHSISELSADIALEGDFEEIHTRGDNSKCLPTDTMKNTVYALAKDHPVEPIEVFALDLAGYFLANNRQVASARVGLTSVPWDRLSLQGREHTHCFTKGSEERAVCEATVSRAGTSVTAGIQGLVILKTTDSGFVGYIKDKYTTLPETDDRIFATSMTASWSYSEPDPLKTDFAGARTMIRTAMVDTFAAHKSRSVQETLYAMGEAALSSCSAIDSIRLSMPNKHCLLINLKPFGMENNNEIFVPTDEPHGLIEATIARR